MTRDFFTKTDVRVSTKTSILNALLCVCVCVRVRVCVCVCVCVLFFYLLTNCITFPPPAEHPKAQQSNDRNNRNLLCMLLQLTKTAPEKITTNMKYN